MSLNETFTFKRFWESVATAIGLFSAIIGIYAYYETKKAEIEYQLIANSNVIDLNTDLSKLDIVYDSTSLKSLKQNLRIISVRVKNSGNEYILKGYYDNNEPLGLSVIEGNIIEKPELIYASNTYLRNNIRIKLVKGNRVTFSDVIIEKSEYFDIKLLILHSNKKIPRIIPYGKIAGIKEIPVIDSYSDNQGQTLKNSILGEIFYGDVPVQIVRTIAYTMIGIPILGIFAIFFLLISDQFTEYKRRRVVIKFKKLFVNIDSGTNKAIFKYFVEFGYSAIHRLKKQLENEDTLNNTYNNISKQKHLSDTNSYGDMGINQVSRHLHRDRVWNSINFMLLNGIIVKTGEGRLIINEKFKNFINQFYAFLDETNFEEAVEYRKTNGSQKSKKSVDSK